MLELMEILLVANNDPKYVAFREELEKLDKKAVIDTALALVVMNDKLSENLAESAHQLIELAESTNKLTDMVNDLLDEAS